MIEKISYLNPTSNSPETIVSFLCDRTRLITGETKDINDQWFYRVKAYQSGFIDRDTGEWIPFKGHELRPSGRGKYVREFDIPISAEGNSLVREFKAQLYESMERIMRHIFRNNDIEFISSIRNFMILSEGDLPWITTPSNSEILLVNKSIFDSICEFILEEEVSDEIIASRLNISKDLARSLINVFSRYNPIFLNEGLVIDRFRSLYGNIHFQATQVPLFALRESPCLDKLLHEDADGQWPAWKRVTFSGDNYPQSKRASLEFARYEVISFCGGKRLNLPVDKNLARATALRLFDLMRYYEGQPEEAQEVRELALYFVEAVK
ncbi:MAG: hypothetical protein ACFE7E_06740 [Candidatus Hodarchaeota archaeon]